MDSAAPRGSDRRKEWRAVPQEPDHGKHGHSDERTIYEEGAGPLQVDYCSITIDGGDDMLRERLQDIARQQHELLQARKSWEARRCRRNQPGSRPAGRIRRGGKGCETSTGFGSSKEVSACGMQLLANVPAAGNKPAGMPVGGAVKVCEKGKHKVLRSSLGQ